MPPKTRGKNKGATQNSANSGQVSYSPDNPTSDSENLDPWLSWSMAGNSQAGVGQGTSSQPTSTDVAPPAGQVTKKKPKKDDKGQKKGKPPAKKQKTADLAWNSASFVPPVITIPDPGAQQVSGGVHSAAAVLVTPPAPVPAPVPAPTPAAVPPAAQFVPPPAQQAPVFCGTPGCTIPNCNYLAQSGHVQQAPTLAPVPQPVPPPAQQVPPAVVNSPGALNPQQVAIQQQGAQQTVTLYEFDEKALERRLEEKFERIADNIFSKQDVFAGTVKTHLDHLGEQYKALSEKPTFKSEHHKKHYERAEVHKNFFKEAKYLLESDQKDTALATLITGIAAIDKYQEKLLIADSSPFSCKLVERLHEMLA